MDVSHSTRTGKFYFCRFELALCSLSNVVIIRCIYTDFHPTWSFMIFCLREEISKRKLLAVNVDSDLQTSGSPVTQVSLQSMHVGDILLIGCFDLNYEFTREDVRKTLAQLKTEHIPPSDPPEYEQFDWALFEESYGGVVGTNTELFDGPVEKDYYYSSKYLFRSHLLLICI